MRASVIKRKIASTALIACPDLLQLADSASLQRSMVVQERLLWMRVARKDIFMLLLGLQR